MSLGRNVVYNLVGQLAPIASALVTIPIYLKLIGLDRFGVLSVAWLLLGYFGLFDLGLGRATSFRIAALRDADPGARADTFWAALTVNVGMGIIGGVALLAAGGLFFGAVFKVAASLRRETLEALPLLAVSVPIATLTGVLTGALQARERFLSTNVVSIVSTLLFQIFPLVIAWRMGPSLPLVLGGAVAARVLALLALGVLCRRELTRGYLVRLRRGEVSMLLGYGAWVTVASVFGPFLVMIDRLVIGAILGASAVAVYAVPYQLAQRIAIVPAALTNALFPRLAAATPQERQAQSVEAIFTLAGILTLPVVGAIFILDPFLHLWLGGSLATQASPIGRILLIGFWINAFALVSYIALQAGGRPDLVSKVLLVELAPYLAGLYFAMKAWGVTGCAIALSARFLLDFVLLGIMAKIHVRVLPLLAAQLACLVLAVAVATTWTMTQPSWWMGALILGLACLASSWLALPIHLRARLGSPMGRPRLGGAR
ncbi:MAG TPA: flippase [Caulobacteraceae bacterium]|jgi:O-antigen/teichoic acid export membrane protein|nr:flippase [Caulobacteraceae bacterium]